MIFISVSGVDITQSDVSRNKIETDNGTLMILSAGPADSGYYECEAYNGVGNHLKKIIEIKVSGKVYEIAKQHALF